METSVRSDSHPRRPDGRSRRWQGQHARRRAEFVDAALAAIDEHGPEASTEQIARQAGVARTRLYKHFDGASDLHGAIAARVSELIAEELEPVWNPHGTPMQMITTALGQHVAWLADHTSLYRYLVRRSPAGGQAGLRETLGNHLTELFSAYLRAFGLDPRPAETAAFGLLGYVESATNRWLDSPTGSGKDELVAMLAGAVWAVLDHTLQAGGIELDPHRPLPRPKNLTAALPTG